MNDTAKPKVKKRLIAAAVAGGIVTAAICAVMNLYLIPAISFEAGGMPIFDMRFAYAPADGRAFLDALTETGKQLYLTRQLPLDFCYPAAYFTFFSALLLILSGENKKWLLLPGALAALDFGENFMSIALLRLSSPGDGLLIAASCLTTAKTVCMYAAFAVILVMIVRAIVRGKRKRP